MTEEPPRLRMFAGPNGSGKTTVKDGLHRPPSWFGIYINPDELEKTIRAFGSLSLGAFHFSATSDEVRDFFTASSFIQKRGLSSDAAGIRMRGDDIVFDCVQMNSYHASVLADFIRRKAMLSRPSFSFETVMSFPNKVDFLAEARAMGCRT